MITKVNWNTTCPLTTNGSTQAIARPPSSMAAVHARGPKPAVETGVSCGALLTMLMGQTRVNRRRAPRPDHRQPLLPSTAGSPSSGHPEIGVDHVRMALDIGRCALRDPAADVEDDDGIANTRDHVHVMLDQEHRQLELVADRHD